MLSRAAATASWRVVATPGALLRLQVLAGAGGMTLAIEAKRPTHGESARWPDCGLAAVTGAGSLGDQAEPETNAVALRPILPVLLLLALCACDRAAPQRDKAGDGAPAAEGPLPGRYRTTIKVTAVRIPGMSEVEAARAATMFGAEGHSSEACVTASDAAAGYRQFAKVAERGVCHYERFSASDGKLAGVMACQVGQGLTQSSQLSGSYTRTGAVMLLRADATGAAQPGGGMAMDSEITSERIGDC